MTDPQAGAAEELMHEVRRSAPREALEAATRRWPEIQDRGCTAPDAETCRLASVAAAVLQELATAELWRSRALSRFIQLDWHEGAAAVLMTSIYKILAAANRGLGERTIDVLVGAPEARLVLEELRPFTRGTGAGYSFGPNPRLIERFLDEKTGFLLMLEGRWDEATRYYDRAESHASGDSRGTLKVALGQCQLRYLSAVNSDGPDAAAASSATEATEQLLAHSEMAHQHDLRQAALVNVPRMRARRRDLVPYEIL